MDIAIPHSKNSFWSPAIRLMNRLSYHRKFSLILAIFTFPLIIPGSAYIAEIGHWRTAAINERAGVKYIKTLMQFLRPLQARRGLLHAIQRGDDALKVHLAANEAQLKAAVARMDEVDREFGDSLRADKRWSTIKERLNSVGTDASDRASGGNFKAYSAIVDEAISLMATAEDTSGLVLDPELDSYYLMDTITHSLPLFTERLGQLRGLGAGYIASTRPAHDERVRLLLLIETLEDMLTRTQRNLDVALGVNPRLRTLSSSERDLAKKSRDYFETTRARFSRPSSAIEPGVFFARTSALLDKYDGIYDAVASTLDELLRRRIARFERRLAMIIGLALSLFLIALYLYLGFYQATMQTVSGLSQAAQRLMAGMHDDCTIDENNDELGEAARSFNQIAGRLSDEHTTLRRTQRRLNAQSSAILALSEASGVAEAEHDVLAALGASLNWPIAAAWSRDPETRTLRCSALWERDGADAASGDFRDICRRRSFASGEGLPGRVEASGTVAYISDVTTDLNFPRNRDAAKAGLKSAFAFPIRVNDRVVKVFEFYSHSLEEFDAEFLSMMSAVGLQFSQFIRKQVLNKELRDSEHRFHLMADTVPQMMWTAGPDGGLDYVNRRLTEYFDRPAESFFNIGWKEFVHAKDLPASVELWSKSLSTGAPLSIDFRLRRADGAYRWHNSSALPQRDDKGAVVKWFGTCTDITERKQAQEQLFRLMVNASPNGIILTDASGRILINNPRAEALFGYDPGELAGLSIEVLVPVESRSRHLAQRADFMAHPRTYAMGAGRDLRGARKDGSTLSIEIGLMPLEHEGAQAILVTATDISLRKSAEDMLLHESLKEKETLLKEIHHRVKNNLQIVSSLLMMEAERNPEGPARQSLRASQSRVASMALVHEALYGTPNLATVGMAEYLGRLIEGLKISYGASAVSITTDFQEVALDAKFAVHCGLITTELISNALKHAFPSGRKGEIRVGFKEEDARVILSVRDDGIGLPEGADPLKSASMGLRLVKIISAQMEASLQFQRERPGTSWRISWAGQARSDGHDAIVER